MALSNLAVQAAKPRDKPYRLVDTNGLFLDVRPTGAKIWRYRYEIAGKENQFTLGEFFADKRNGHLTLEAARRARDDARVLVRKGIHPAHERQQAMVRQIAENESTFKAIAEEWISRQRPKWSSKYAEQIKHILKTDVYPTIGALPITTITPNQILQILFKVEKRGATTFAHLIRQWVSAIYRYAIITQRAQTDPAAPLRGVIARNKVRHSKSLSREQIREFVEKLGAYKGEPGTILGLRIMLLTFVRTIELRAARWPEINLERAEWRIPAERMKMREEHIVPLSRQAVRLLRQLHDISSHQVFLFPNRRTANTYITSTTLNRALERMKVLGKGTLGFSAHGFRSTASTLLNEAGFRGDVIERQLAHQERNNVRASYNHADYMSERKTMMQQWADMIDEIVTSEPNQILPFVRPMTQHAE
jgi:integrase